MLLQQTKLLRKNRDKLVPARLGQQLLALERSGTLQALLFHVAFWHVNLGYFGRNLIQSWPQNDVGIVLWSLSVSADDWLDPETLTRLCTVPVPSVVQTSWDLGAFAAHSPAVDVVRLIGKTMEGEGRAGTTAPLPEDAAV